MFYYRAYAGYRKTLGEKYSTTAAYSRHYSSMRGYVTKHFSTEFTKKLGCHIVGRDTLARIRDSEALGRWLTVKRENERQLRKSCIKAE